MTGNEMLHKQLLALAPEFWEIIDLALSEQPHAEPPSATGFDAAGVTRRSCGGAVAHGQALM